MSKHQNNFPQNIHDVIDVDYEPVTRQKGLQAMFSSSQAHHTLNPLRKANQLHTEDYCRALLTKVALEHTTALSAVENQALAVAPRNADLFRILVGSYAIGAAGKIGRW